MRRIFSLVILIVAISACGTKGTVSVDNPSKAALTCLTELGGTTENFDTSESFIKETTKPGFLYVSCQKKTKGDLSTVTATVTIGTTDKKTGTTSAEYGIASASGSW